MTRYLDSSTPGRTVLAVTLAIHDESLAITDHKAILRRLRTKMGREPGYLLIREVGPGGGLHYHGFVISDQSDQSKLHSTIRKAWSESCGVHPATASIGPIQTTTARAVAYAFGVAGFKQGQPIPLFRPIREGGPTMTLTSRFYRATTAAELWTEWKTERYGPPSKRPDPATSWRPSDDEDAA